MRPRQLIGVLVLTVLAYAPTWRAGFVYEDLRSVERNEVVQQTAPWTFAQLRSLSWASLRLNHVLDGNHPRGYHALNVAIHLVNGVLVYLIATGLAGPGVALWASGLFLLHPLQTEAVAYVSGRTELLATMGILLALWAALQEPGRRRWPIAVLIGGVTLAVGAKEIGIVVFPLLAWYLLVFHRPILWRHRWVLATSLILGVGVVLLMSREILAGDVGVLGSERGVFSYVAIQCSALWRYVVFVVWPVGLSIDHDYDFINHTLAYGLLGLTVISAIGIAWLVPRQPVLAFSLGWILIALLPRLVVRIPEYLNEHQMYVPMIGLSLAIGLAAQASQRAVYAKG